MVFTTARSQRISHENLPLLNSMMANHWLLDANLILLLPTWRWYHAALDTNIWYRQILVNESAHLEENSLRSYMTIIRIPCQTFIMSILSLRRPPIFPGDTLSSTHPTPHSPLPSSSREMDISSEIHHILDISGLAFESPTALGGWPHASDKHLWLSCRLKVSSMICFA